MHISTVDLVAAEARYHKLCIKKLYRAPNTGKKRCRLEYTDVSKAMEYASSCLETRHGECNFFFDGIFQEFEGQNPTNKTISSKIIEKYGEDITVTTKIHRLLSKYR